MELARAREIVEQFSTKRVLVTGDIALDRYVFGNVERLNPEAPVPILHAAEEKQATGAAGNTAKNAAMLGAQTTFVGVVGDDAGAQRLKAAAVAEGYEAQLVVDPDRPTIEKIRYLVRNQQMLRVDWEETKEIAGQIEESVIQAIQAAASEADAIIVSDYAKGVITEKVAQAILQTGKDKGIIVAADVKPSRAGWFSGAAFISPNRKEAHEILGFNRFENGGREPQELARGLQEKMNCDVFVTLSEKGIYVLETGASEGTHVPQEHVVEVFDVSGAGDTAAAVLTLARLSGASAVEAAQLANAAGAVVVQKVGAVGLTQSELLNMIGHSHE